MWVPQRSFRAPMYQLHGNFDLGLVLYGLSSSAPRQHMCSTKCIIIIITLSFIITCPLPGLCRFALCLYDVQQMRVLAARDGTGVIPLFEVGEANEGDT